MDNISPDDMDMMSSVDLGKILLQAVGSFNPNLELIKNLLRFGADLSLKTYGGMTALHNAASNGDKNMVKWFIKYEAPLNVQNESGFTPLILATLCRKSGVVNALIEAGADLNLVTDVGFTALHWAILKGDTKITKSLLIAGADVNIKDNHGNTPLIICDYSPQLRSMLIESGADVNVQNTYGNSPLHSASRDRDIYGIRLLIKYGDNTDVLNNDGYTPWDIADEYITTNVPELNPTFNG